MGPNTFYLNWVWRQWTTHLVTIWILLYTYQTHACRRRNNRGHSNRLTLTGTTRMVLFATTVLYSYWVRLAGVVTARVKIGGTVLYRPLVTFTIPCTVLETLNVWTAHPVDLYVFTCMYLVYRYVVNERRCICFHFNYSRGFQIIANNSISIRILDGLLMKF